MLNHGRSMHTVVWKLNELICPQNWFWLVVAWNRRCHQWRQQQKRCHQQQAVQPWMKKRTACGWCLSHRQLDLELKLALRKGTSRTLRNLWKKMRSVAHFVNFLQLRILAAPSTPLLHVQVLFHIEYATVDASNRLWIAADFKKTAKKEGWNLVQYCN